MPGLFDPNLIGNMLGTNPNLPIGSSAFRPPDLPGLTPSPPGYSPTPNIGSGDPGYSPKQDFGPTPGYSPKLDLGSADPGYSPTPDFGPADPGYNVPDWLNSLGNQISTAITKRDFGPANKYAVGSHLEPRLGSTTYTGRDMEDYLKNNLAENVHPFIDDILKLGGLHGIVKADPGTNTQYAGDFGRQDMMDLGRRSDVPADLDMRGYDDYNSYYNHQTPNEIFYTGDGDRRWKLRSLALGAKSGPETLMHELAHAGDFAAKTASGIDQRHRILQDVMDPVLTGDQRQLTNISKQLNGYNLPDYPYEIPSVAAENTYAQNNPDTSNFANMHSRYLALPEGGTGVGPFGPFTKGFVGPGGLENIRNIYDILAQVVNMYSQYGKIPQPPGLKG